jgi:hypothetical protein
MLTERSQGIGSQPAFGVSPSGRTPWKIEHGTELAEVISGRDHCDELIFTVSPGPVYLDLSFLDDINKVASVALFENDPSLLENQLLRIAIGPCEVRDELDDAIGDMGDPVVVGRDEHQASCRRQLPDQDQNALYLNVVKM